MGGSLLIIIPFLPTWISWEFPTCSNLQAQGHPRTSSCDVDGQLLHRLGLVLGPVLQQPLHLRSTGQAAQVQWLAADLSLETAPLLQENWLAGCALACLKKIGVKVNCDDDIPKIWKNLEKSKSCSKAPTRKFSGGWRVRRRDVPDQQVWPGKDPIQNKWKLDDQTAKTSKTWHPGVRVTTLAPWSLHRTYRKLTMASYHHV